MAAPKNCLIAQYLKDRGCERPSVGRTFFKAEGKLHNLRPGFDYVACRGGTFGGALKLLNELEAANAL